MSDQPRADVLEGGSMIFSEATRILQVGKYYPPYRGGMETHLEQLSSLLNHRVDLNVLVANDTRQTSFERVGGVKVTRLGRMLNLSGAPVCPNMVRAIRAAKADLVHLHFPNPMAVFAYLASGHRGPVVATWHSDIVRQNTLAKFFQ